MTNGDYFGTYGKMKKTIVGGIGTIYDGEKFVSHVGGMPIQDNLLEGNSNKNNLEKGVAN